jgi:ribosome-associated heat shock protein Hsp15
MSDSTRVDRWLWAVRVFKTRTAATEACRAGHVRVNGASAKPAATVRPGDAVSVRLPGRERVLEVLQPIERRVGAALVAESALDRSPPAPAREEVVTPFHRVAGSGRPTKRDRRELDRLRRG